MEATWVKFFSVYFCEFVDLINPTAKNKDMPLEILPERVLIMKNFFIKHFLNFGHSGLLLLVVLVVDFDVK